MRSLLAALCLLPGLLWANPFTGQSADFLPVDEAFSFSHQVTPEGGVQLEWEIADGYYLYRERMQFSGLQSGWQPELPAGLPYSDEFFGDVEIYRDSLRLTVPAGSQGELTLGWQGCADAGLCYPPEQQVIQLSAEGSPPAASSEAADQSLAAGLQQHTLIWSVLVFFALGLLLAFTPCSLPMLPLLAGLVVGSQASTPRSLLLASVYVVCMAAVFASLGVLAAALGGNLQAALQQPWLLGAFVALFVLLALPMFGLFELQLPAFVRDRLDAAGQRQRGGSLLGAGLLGLLSGVLVGPCMTAPLAGALLYIAQTGNMLLGALVLFALGLGMGLPLLLLVTVGKRFLPRPGPWMERIKAAFGFLLLAAAVFVGRPLLDPGLWLGVWGVWLISLGLAVMALRAEITRGQVAWATAASLTLLWGLLLLLGAAGGSADWRQPLAVYSGQVASAPVVDAADVLNTPEALKVRLDEAAKQQQWSMLVYTADWCVSCKVMEQRVFARPDVQAELAAMQQLRLDVTSSNAASRGLLERYQVMGPPSILWIGPDGEERRELRITGEIDAARFLSHLQQVKQSQ
ncbi:MAG: protein-disulfide reductase DsbD [Pseudomonadaceae bacterium]|nr:MAG: protein-disulfide reductase DsbD [Pseudomonadaceae bacterium]